MSIRMFSMQANSRRRPTRRRLTTQQLDSRRLMAVDVFIPLTTAPADEPPAVVRESTPGQQGPAAENGPSANENRDKPFEFLRESLLKRIEPFTPNEIPESIEPPSNESQLPPHAVNPGPIPDALKPFINMLPEPEENKFLKLGLTSVVVQGFSTNDGQETEQVETKPPAQSDFTSFVFED